ncbi:MAG: hypothetical protein COW30_06135 [Rhodospirillales bacterium CG15_BIG_FIL_POST_REV_8_21_14_020_66_15]|nr:MAG: hypothetical protein COW30_06135 [Rhodospirillales bacterium CG15_BIG_FIL_POST_REV_8_21_14_020_66_15]
MAERALVLFPSGQDSTACLAWAPERFDRVELIVEHSHSCCLAGYGRGECPACTLRGDGWKRFSQGRAK